MKRKLIALSQRYVAALRKHLKQGPRAIPPCGTARGLGRQAVAIGLETLDVARIHDGALASLEASSGKDGVIESSLTDGEASSTSAETRGGAGRDTHARPS